MRKINADSSNRSGLTEQDRRLLHALSDGSKSEWDKALQNFTNLPAEVRNGVLSRILPDHYKWMLDQERVETAPRRATAQAITAFGGLTALSILTTSVIGGSFAFTTFLGSVFAASVGAHFIIRKLALQSPYLKRFRLLISKVQDSGAASVILSFLYSKILTNANPLFQSLSDSLIRLLPEVHADETQFWDATQRKMLLEILMRQTLTGEAVFEDRIRLEALRLLETGGARNSLSIVQSIAKGETKWRPTSEMIHLAEEVLPSLRERMEREEQGLTQLRGSSAPEMAETLLRPASGVSDQKETELLLPSNSPALPKEVADTISGDVKRESERSRPLTSLPERKDLGSQITPSNSNSLVWKKVEVLNGLNSGFDEERELASKAYNQLPEKTRKAIILDLLWDAPNSAERKNWGRWRNGSNWQYIPGVAGAVASFLLVTSGADISWMTLSVFGMSIVGVSFTINKQTTRTPEPILSSQIQLVNLIDRCEDVSLVPHALNFLDSHTNDASMEPLRRSLNHLLRRLMPKVSEANYGDWSPEAKGRLQNGFLFSQNSLADSHSEIRLEVIRILGMDDRAGVLSLLEQVAKRPENAEIRETALISIGQIRDRISRNSVNQHLLRASSQNHQEENLLRPAVSVEDIQPQELLRASSAIPSPLSSPINNHESSAENDRTIIISSTK